jgi:hypothetical protein
MGRLNVLISDTGQTGSSASQIGRCAGQITCSGGGWGRGGGGREERQERARVRLIL